MALANLEKESAEASAATEALQKVFNVPVRGCVAVSVSIVSVFVSIVSVFVFVSVFAFVSVFVSVSVFVAASVFVSVHLCACSPSPYLCVCRFLTIYSCISALYAAYHIAVTQAQKHMKEMESQAHSMQTLAGL